jgi:hypothetical protein
MNIMDASGFFAQGIYLPPSGGSDPGTVNATGAANLFGTGEFGPSSVATIRPVKFVAPAPGALGGFGLCTVNRGANIRNCDFQNMGANPAVLIHGDGGYGVRLDGMTGATGNTDVGIDTTQAKGVNVVLGAGNTVTGTVGDIRVNGGQIQTHANYTVSSYRDAGANFIQGSAGNTSNPRDSFTGLHIGDVGPVAEYFAKQNVEISNNSALFDSDLISEGKVLADQQRRQPARVAAGHLFTLGYAARCGHGERFGALARARASDR